MKEKVYALIDSYAEEYAEMLAKWIRVPSLKAAPAENAPFGTELRRMLDMAMADAASFGFAVRDFDGYACDATLGDAPEMVAVLGHLDVVPVGDGWQVEPFGGVRKGDVLYGRGTSDDKGPSLAAMFAMRAIREAGVPLKKSIRMILGCDEESGWQDMVYYAAHTEMPEVGFSPDADFPVINIEKGALRIHADAPVSAEGLQVKKLWVGERTNVIPGEAKALLAGGQELVEKTAAFAAKTGFDYTAELTDEGVWVKAEGIPGHAAMPWGKRNANCMLLQLLKELGVQGALLTLADTLKMEHNGESLGCKYEDELSGELTCNIGILHLANGVISMALDMRCPITADLKALRDNAMAHLPGFTATDVGFTEPHHVPAESELVTSLMAAYTEITGQEAKPLAIGGGTYAKVLKQGVAFGSCFPGDVDAAHEANESVEISKMVTSMKIFASGLMRLCAE